MEYINEETKFWDHSYKVYLSEFIEPLLVNAKNEQEALDFAIDYAEEKGFEGLFLSLEEVEELEKEGFLEEHVCGGNHCRYLSSIYFHIEQIE